MQKWVPDFEKAGVRIVALTTDPPEKNLRVFKRFGSSITFLSDPDGRVLKQIGMWDDAYKIAAFGYFLLGPDLKVLRAFRGVYDPNDEAKATFLAAVAAAGKGG